MKDFRIALVAHKSPLGKISANLSAIEDWVRRAARKKADLVCLPELSISGHGGHAAMIQEPEPVPSGESVERLSVLASDLNVYICAGIAELEGSATYNTQFIVGPRGYVGKQRKVHLSGDEYFLFRGGTEIPVFDLPFAKVGIVICYDNLFPEMARCCTLEGAEVVLATHAARFGPWPKSVEGRRKKVASLKDQWRTVHKCRAYENRLYVGLCNTVGRSAQGLNGVEANHAGGCMLVGPDGQVLAESRSCDVAEEMIVTNLKAEPLHKARNQECYSIRTRRVDAFGALTRKTT